MKVFQNIFPAVAAGYLIYILIIIMFSANPVLELMAFTGGLLFCVFTSEFREIRKELKFYFFLILIITLSNPVFSHNGITPLFFVNGNAVTVEAIAYGANFGVMLVSVLIWFKIFGKIIDSDKFLYLFGRGTPRLAIVVSVAMRYVPMLKKRAIDIYKSHKALGMYTSESRFDRAVSLLNAFSVLIGWSLENALDTAASMRARGFGLKGHSCYSIFRFRRSDLLFLLSGLFCAAATISGMVSGNLDFIFYPEISKINMSPPAVFSYIAFAVLTYLPLLAEAGESIRWTYYKSKI